MSTRGPSAAAAGRAIEADWRRSLVSDPEETAPKPAPTHDPGVVIHPVPRSDAR